MRLRALAVLAVVIAGCGGREAERAEPPTLDRAAEQTAAAGPYHFEIDYELTGVPGGMRGEGAFATADRGWLRLDFSDTGDEDELSSFEVRYVGGKTYTRFSDGADAKWLVDAGHEGLFDVMPFGQFQSPHGALNALRNAAGDVAMIGEETIDGVHTLHFRGRVAGWELFGASAPADERRELEAEMRKARVGEVPVDVWVDDDALLRKLHVAFAFVEDGKDANVAITMRFFDFGKPVDVSAPAKDELEDFSGMLGDDEMSGFCEKPGKPHHAEAVAAALRAQGFDVEEGEAMCVAGTTTLFAYARGAGEDTEVGAVCMVGPEGIEEDTRGVGQDEFVVEANVTCLGEKNGLARAAEALESLRPRKGG